MFNTIDFKPGRIRMDSYKYYNLEKTMKSQIHDYVLDEDFLQVIYPNDVFLDVGWFGGKLNLKTGRFEIIVLVSRNIEDANFFDFQYFRRQTQKIDELIEFVKQANEIAKDISTKIEQGAIDLDKECLSDNDRFHG